MSTASPAYHVTYTVTVHTSLKRDHLLFLSLDATEPRACRWVIGKHRHRLASVVILQAIAELAAAVEIDFDDVSSTRLPSGDYAIWLTERDTIESCKDWTYCGGLCLLLHTAGGTWRKAASLTRFPELLTTGGISGNPDSAFGQNPAITFQKPLGSILRPSLPNCGEMVIFS